MKRILEKIYDLYLEEVKNSVEECSEELPENLEKAIINMFSQPLEEYDLETKDRIEPGDIYLMFMKDTPIYYVIYEEIDENLFEVLKATNYWELSSNLDLITEINNELFAIESWNFFYLTKEEVEKSVYWGKLSEDDCMIIKDFRNGKVRELPNSKRGLTPISENSTQSKFKQREAELLREYAFRLLGDLLED